MTLIAVPDYDAMVLTSLGLLAPSQVNRSKWTGARKVIGMPGVETWRGKVSVETIVTEEEERPWRAFLFAMRGPVNSFRWPLPCNQHIGGKPVVGAGATAGYTLPLTGLQPNATVLKAGQFMTVPLPSGKFRAVVLTADLVGNGAGVGTASFEPALTEIPATGAVLESAAPFIEFAMIETEQGLGTEQGVSGTSFDVEEAR